MQSDNTKLKAWKYLRNGESPYRNKKYKVGKIYIENNFDTDEQKECSSGLNVATLSWCLKDCKDANEFIEVEFFVRDIIAIPFNTDGKFRVKRFKVLRQVNRVGAYREIIKAIRNN
jgi:hypothetical protein